MVIPTDSTMLTKSLAMQTILTTSWITISTAESSTVVITSLTDHLFVSFINSSLFSTLRFSILHLEFCLLGTFYAVHSMLSLWSCAMRRNRPFFFSSSAGEPISATRPPESRTI